MREYFRDGKPVYHSTDLRNYLICPMMMKLGREIELEPNTAMRGGLLLEGYVFGFKEDQKELEGRKRENTLNKLKERAEILKPYFKDGKPFQRIEHDFGDYILTGEVDYLAKDRMFDLKKTGKIKTWLNKNKNGMLQAVYYNLINFHNTGEILPFRYVIDADDVGFIRIIDVEVTEDDLKVVHEKIEEMHNTLFYETSDNCFNTPYGTCDYLNNCEIQEKIKNTTVKWSEL